MTGTAVTVINDRGVENGVLRGSTITVDSFDPDQRFRAYRLDPDPDRSPVEVCSAATPEALGLALCTIGREHFDAVGEGHPAVGIMDTLDRKWIVNPWNREGR